MGFSLSPNTVPLIIMRYDRYAGVMKTTAEELREKKHCFPSICTAHPWACSVRMCIILLRPASRRAGISSYDFHAVLRTYVRWDGTLWYSTELSPTFVSGDHR